MPKTKRRLIKLTFYGVIILQAIIPPAYCFVIFNYVRKKNVDLYYQTVRWFLTLYTIQLLGQLLQGIVLLVGILKLKQLIKDFGY